MKSRLPHFWLLLLPLFLYYMGGVCNLVVVTANHGSMPVVIPPQFVDSMVDDDGRIDDIHAQEKKADHLKILDDWIQVPHIGVISPGDCLLLLGNYLSLPFVFAYAAMVYRDSDPEKYHSI